MSHCLLGSITLPCLASSQRHPSVCLLRNRSHLYLSFQGLKHCRTFSSLFDHSVFPNTARATTTPPDRSPVVSLCRNLSGRAATAQTDNLDNVERDRPDVTAKPKVVILTGPTAVGKTAVSLQLAKALNGEIVSADSVQVYRGLDIGSDKLPVEERQGIPHHVIDILEPHQDFSAGDFYAVARRATQDILNRGRVPIVVGGTAFYLRWFIFGKPSTPKSTAVQQQQVEEALNKAYAEASAGGRQLDKAEQWEAAVKLVETLGDATSADRLRGVPNNWYRMHRVLEIILTTGKPLPDLDINTAAPLDYDFRCYFLHRPRMQLYRRIDQRCEEMMMAGVMKESAWLLSLGLSPNTNSATRAIGYRQSMEGLQKCMEEGGQVTQQHVLQCVSSIQSASRQYCHRQLTWFRGDAMWRWVDVAQQDSQRVVEELVAAYQEPQHQGTMCGESGRLTKSEQQAMRQYSTQMKHFHDEQVVQRVRDDMQQIVSELMQGG